MSYCNYDDVELGTTVSTGRHSETSSSHSKIYVDKIYISLNEIDRANARIKKQI